METFPRLAGHRSETAITPDKPPLRLREVQVEAARCLYCYDAPCARGCPAGVDVPEFIRSISSGAMVAAARLVLGANALAETCGCVCPTEVLCAGECVLQRIEGQQPIAIGRLQRFVVNWARTQNLNLFAAGPPSGRRVALVGAGPASIAAAHELIRLGHQAVIFEKSTLPGGLNLAAIAPHKMHADLPLAETDWLLGIGVELRTSTAVGRDVSFSELERDFDAVFIGVGMGPDLRLGLPGEDADGVVGAIELLRGLKTGTTTAPGHWNRALCVGGGNSAIDVVRTLSELGVPEVVLVYRRSEEQMKGYRHEWRAAKLAGRVETAFLTQPLAVLTDGSRVRGLRCQRMTLGEVDASGRPAPVPVPGSEHDIAGDAVILAVGQAGARSVLPGLPEDIRFAGTRIEVEPATGATSRPGYWAGGDVANGGKEVVNAAAEGRRAARAIDTSLRGKGA